MRREKPGALSHIADVPVGIENPRGTGLRPSARRRSLFLPPSSPPSLSPSCRFIYVQKCRHLAESVGSYEGERQRKRKRAREKQAARGRERERVREARGRNQRRENEREGEVPRRERDEKSSARRGSRAFTLGWVQRQTQHSHPRFMGW